MSVLVAKRYVKAIVKDANVEDIKNIASQLDTIALAYKDTKFLSIINDIDVTTAQKVELLLSFGENSNTTTNLIKLLGENKRLDILPAIADELNATLAELTNTYTGVVYTKESLSDEYISTLEENFSKKFDVKLSLSQNVCDYDGIKVDIEGLGVEIGLSKDRLRSQLKDYILKAI
jgi:F-type H+-transporting ATPase subunit delta